MEIVRTILIICLLVFLLWSAALFLMRNKKIPHRVTPDDLGIRFEEICIPAKDGGQLYGWWIPGEKARPVIILAHGWGSNLGWFLPFIRELHPRGYHLLMFDARNHGSSTRLNYPTVWSFMQDILAAVDFASERAPSHSTPVTVIGHSVGGSAAINAAFLDSRITRAVTLGAFSHPVEVMKQQFHSWHLPYIPFGWLFIRYFQSRTGLNYDRIAPVANISAVSGPLFLIHGEKDDIVPVQQAHTLFQAANREKVQVWIIPGSGHKDSHTKPHFWERVLAFLEETLQNPSSRPG